MSHSQHTPGPWRGTGGLRRRAGAVPPRTTDAIVADAPPAPHQVDDFHYYGGVLVCEGVDPENFHLITAAPDLYEAALMVLANAALPHDVERALRAAVEKADGGKSRG